MDLNNLLSEIAKGDFVNPSDILPYLCSETKEERCKVNARLAAAYLESKNFQQAKIFIQRAWILSDFSPDLLPLYLKIHSSLDDISSIKEAYKRLGMKKASERKITEAIGYLTQSMYAYAKYYSIDRYDYDFDILERIEKLAEPYRFEPRFQPGLLADRKIRLAYLTHGMMQTSSVLVKINRLFARFHDKSQFEVTFFLPESKTRLFTFKQATDSISFFREYNCKVVAPNSNNNEERLIEVATQIFNYQPDILITNALLAETLERYFIASLHPAPIVIGFIQGPPPQFVAPGLDWSIAWVKHQLIDCPCNCSLVDLEVDLPERESITFYTKKKLNIPEDSLILMSGGRVKKFQEPNFWRAILDIMRQYTNVYYVAIGIDEEPSFLKDLLIPELKMRLIVMGWREDYLKILGLADIVIDTFPSGSGVVLMDAMALGVPIVSFKNNYMRLFDQTDWSPAEEFIEIPDLIVERGNFEQFKLLISKLIADQEYRLKMAELCKEQIHMKKGNPERMVRRCESIYVKVLEKKLQENKISVSSYNQPSVLDEIGFFEYLTLSSRGILRNTLTKYAMSCYGRLPFICRESIRKYYTRFKK